MKTAKWGEDSELIGPRDIYRNSLLLNEIIKHVKAGKILDFGCGRGSILFSLAKMGFEMFGIDNSDLVINYLNGKKTSLPYGKSIHIIKGSDNPLRDYKESFDAVFAGEVIEHFEDDMGLVKRFYSTLKPGGICVASVPAHMNLWDINDDYSRHFRRYETNELSNIFIKSKFKIIKLYYWGFPLTLIWHRLIFLKYINKKIDKKVSDRKLTGLIKFFFTNELLMKVFSLPFYLDNLFNWLKLGNGIIIVAQKI